MARIADQRQPVIGDPRGMVKAERIGRARAQQSDLAEEAAHRGLGLAAKSSSLSDRKPGASSACTDQTIAERWPSASSVIGQKANGPEG
jgi:hypothetical protein